MGNKKELTSKQKKFLEVLFDEAEGNLSKAKKLAGYSSQTKVREVVKTLEKEIAEATAAYIASSAPQAAFGVVSIIENPTKLGNRDKLSAAKEILDRSGFKHTEKVEVTTTNPVFILPAKKED